MPKKRTFYSEEERKAHHEKKQREADLQIQELTKHWENDPKDIAEYLAFSTQFYKYSLRNTMLIYRQRPDSVFIASYTHWKELMLHGEPSSYEGRQSFGTGEGSLIDHIKRLNTLCNENPQWENYLLETGGSDALLQDRHEKEYILNEFIPYLNLHVTLSEIEQSVSEKLGETDELTLERSEQFAALQQNVRTVRAMLNQGNYDFSVAQINELSPKFAEWMRQISKKSIQQSSENTLTKEEIIHDFEQIATQNRAEIRQEQHEEFEITML